MRTLEDLEKQYSQIPQDMRLTRRWVCYNIELDNNNGKQKKVPINPITGSYARSNDSTTWSTFKGAINGSVKSGMVGIGFMLGKDNTTGVNYFGVDLDNHEDSNGNKPMNDDEFYDFSSEFVNALNSYSEYSKNKGIHIICKGVLPKGANRKNNCPVEMYDSYRFFAMTGDVLNNAPVNDRTNEIVALWEKYLKPVEIEQNNSVYQRGIVVNNDGSVIFGGADRLEQTVLEFEASKLSDVELINKIKNSQNGPDFISLFNGDISAYGNDHSAADMAFCKLLAFWTSCDRTQMDRIFRSSGLMRDKWDQKRGQLTYGDMTLDKAIANQYDVYKPAKEKVVIKPNITVKQQPVTQQDTEIVTFDELGDPIVNIKQIFKHYTLTDTGNAERFYDQFGGNFRRNTDNNKWNFWDGKTWINDDKNYIRKYADRIIDVLKAEIANTRSEMEEAAKKGEDGKEEVKELQNIEKAQLQNLNRVSNKAGKDAMISELEHLHDIPVKNDQFNTQENLLNTQSGVVNLSTGEIMPFDKKLMLSKNTNCKVSYEEPVTWLKFLHDIFERPNPEETEEIINCVQMYLGISLTGRTNKEQLFILYGNGSNGKSTFVETVRKIFGDYGTAMNSDLLIQTNSSSQSNEFSLSSLLGARFVSTSETAEGKKLDEVMIKKMTSGEQLNAQYKYGQPFTFSPTFSPWISTNNKPIIRATDFGTWRRVFFIPFLNTFSGEKKDVNMPKKLMAEQPQILGWIIKGNVKLEKEYKSVPPKPKCLEEALADYKQEMNVISSFIKARCVDLQGYKTSAQKLYQVYKEWAKDNNEYLMSETKFRLEMPKNGYALKRDANEGWVYVGLKLATDNRGHSFAYDEDEY